MQKIQEQLSAVSQTLSILKSPVDGVVALLESIVVIEVDANNELKPAQQTAKVGVTCSSATRKVTYHDINVERSLRWKV